MRAKSHTGENAQPYGLIILEVLRGRHDVSYRCQLDCLVNGLFRQKRKHQGPYGWHFFKVTGEFLS